MEIVTQVVYVAFLSILWDLFGINRETPGVRKHLFRLFCRQDVEVYLVIADLEKHINISYPGWVVRGGSSVTRAQKNAQPGWQPGPPFLSYALKNTFVEFSTASVYL